MLMYPIFITDDEDAEVPLASMPGQCRWGVNKLEGFLGPLVKKGLGSVILFGVPLRTPKVSQLHARRLKHTHTDELNRTHEAHWQTIRMDQ